MKPKMEMRFYLIIAMARNGHHAFMNWIGSQFPGECIHFNNGVRGWEDKEFRPYGKRRQMWNMNRLTGTQGRIINFEDIDIEDWSKFKMETFTPFKYGTVYPIIFMRDPWNWIASSLRCGGDAGGFINHPIGKDYMGLKNKPNRVELFKRQMKEALRITKHMSNVIPVTYNDWFTSKEYRKKIAEQLDLPFTDAGLNDVPGFGGGSSFDHFKHQHKRPEK